MNARVRRGIGRRCLSTLLAGRASWHSVDPDGIRERGALESKLEKPANARPPVLGSATGEMGCLEQA